MAGPQRTWVRALLTLVYIIWIFSSAAGQDIVTITSTTTTTTVATCVETTYVTQTLDYCPCPPVFPPPILTATGCSLVTSSASGSGPSTTAPPPGEAFIISLTIPVSSGDRTIVLSRVGNTIGVGGQIIYFNLSTAGELRDSETGDTVFVFLSGGAIRKRTAFRKRFEGTVDLLIGPVVPAAGVTTAWRKTSQGEILLYAGENSANPLTLGFGVATTTDGDLDETVPIQMYDINNGVPDGIEDGPATTSAVTTGTSNTSRTRTRTTTGPTSDDGPSTTVTSTFYGNTAFTSTSTAGGTEIIIIQSLYSTTTRTAYGSEASTSTLPFNSLSPTITLIDIFPQVVVSTTVYGPTGFTQTFVTGSNLPTVTAQVQDIQSTYTNTTFGPTSTTLSLIADSTLPTATLYLQLTPTATTTSISWVYNVLNPTTSISYGSNGIATIVVESRQVVIFTTVYASSDFTTTFGSTNPTATATVGISPTATTIVSPTLFQWNLTTTSTQTLTQSPDRTLSLQVHVPYPPASFISFLPPQLAGASAFLDANTTTVAGREIWYLRSQPTSKSKFIQLGTRLILATNFTNGQRLPHPAYSFGDFSGGQNLFSPIYFAPWPVYNEIPPARQGGIGWRTLSIRQIPDIFNYAYLNANFTQFLNSQSADIYYWNKLGPPVTPLFINTDRASSSLNVTTETMWQPPITVTSTNSYERLLSTMMMFVTSATSVIGRAVAPTPGLERSVRPSLIFRSPSTAQIAQITPASNYTEYYKDSFRWI